MSVTRWPAEVVLPGHPDKLSDTIADRIVEEAARREQRALCGVEVGVHRDRVFVTGRVAGEGAGAIDIPGIVREVFARAGHDDAWRPAPTDLRVVTDICLGALNPGEADFRALSDDQSIVTGYATDLPGANYLPPEHWLIHRIGRALARLRTERPDLMLGPDGKAALVLADDGCRVELASFTASMQQGPDGSAVALTRAVREAVAQTLAGAQAAIPTLSSALPEDIQVNGAGDFVVGGPEGDNGLSGKKLVVDAYGPRVPIGGGALSGKDFYKADRAGALLARRVAKAVVMAGAARDCLVTLLISPGADRFTIVSLRDSDGRCLDLARWERLLDLTLAGCGDRYARTPGLAQVARWGHFTDPSLPWERVSFDPGPVDGQRATRQSSQTPDESWPP